LIYDKIVKKILLSLIFFVAFFSLFVSKAHADANCSLTWENYTIYQDPAQPWHSTPMTNYDVRASVNIKIVGVANPDNHVEVKLTGPGINRQAYYGDSEGNTYDITIGDQNNISIRNMTKDGWERRYNEDYTASDNHTDPFLLGTYVLNVYNKNQPHDDSSKPLCTVPLPVVYVNANAPYCNPIVNSPQYPDTDIKLTVTNFHGPAESQVKPELFYGNYDNTTGHTNETGDPISQPCLSQGELNSGKSFGKLALGTYKFIVKSKCDSPFTAPDQDLCTYAFKVVPKPPPDQPKPPPGCISDGDRGCTGGSKIGADPVIGTSSTTQCSSDQGTCCGCTSHCIGASVSQLNADQSKTTASSSICQAGAGEDSFGSVYSSLYYGPPTDPCPNGQCATAVGSINTSPEGFVNSLIGVILSIVGGIATILIIISGYRLMISQGNPENIKNAKDQLTAAIIGLLFVIFSLVILQIIGVNILGLPGFNS
jgi:hypothetical protein